MLAHRTQALLFKKKKKNKTAHPKKPFVLFHKGDSKLHVQVLQRFLFCSSWDTWREGEAVSF